MTEADRITKAERARVALDVLGTKFDSVEAEWYTEMVNTARSTDPRRPEIVMRLCDGISAVRKVRSLIEADISDGKVAEGKMADKAKDARMSDFQRKTIGA